MWSLPLVVVFVALVYFLPPLLYYNQYIPYALVCQYGFGLDNGLGASLHNVVGSYKILYVK